MGGELDRTAINSKISSAFALLMWVGAILDSKAAVCEVYLTFWVGNPTWGVFELKLPNRKSEMSASIYKWRVPLRSWQDSCCHKRSFFLHIWDGNADNKWWTYETAQSLCANVTLGTTLICNKTFIVMKVCNLFISRGLPVHGQNSPSPLVLFLWNRGPSRSLCPLAVPEETLGFWPDSSLRKQRRRKWQKLVS